jgi:hypothetical protein
MIQIHQVGVQILTSKEGFNKLSVKYFTTLFSVLPFENLNKKRHNSLSQTPKTTNLGTVTTEFVVDQKIFIKREK